MSLRNIFASVGLCETTQQVEARPRLVTQLMNLARSYSMVMATRNDEPLSSYEDRLHEMLSGAKYWQLENMIGQNILPVLDGRLKNAKTGFLSREVYATFYQDKGRRILGLYDRGDVNASFWGRGNFDYLSKVLYETGKMDCNVKRKEPVYIGELYRQGQIKHFRWKDAKHMRHQMARNPWMLEPPLSFITEEPRSKLQNNLNPKHK